MFYPSIYDREKYVQYESVGADQYVCAWRKIKMLTSMCVHEEKSRCWPVCVCMKKIQDAGV